MNNPDKNKQPIPDPTPEKQQPGKENPPPVQPPPDKPEIEPIPREIPDRDTPHTPANPQATGEQEQAFKKQSPDKH
ncbi:hypothetical protein [Chitinophaga sp. OAE865]|uniref:hypothetical protein n=1 Tax=Chitinophaga sp. OAE865 TaxID=2817898 RepID=UPI001AE2E871